MESQHLNDIKNVRKKWLISFLTILIICSTGIIVNIFFEPDFIDILKTSTQLSIWAYITYYCSYKKCGTGWLMFNLIMIPFQMSCLYLLFFLNRSAEDLLVNLFILTPLFSWFWINCFKLRKFNKMKCLEN
jgi:hypothetical protein